MGCGLYRAARCKDGTPDVLSVGDDLILKTLQGKGERRDDQSNSRSCDDPGLYVCQARCMLDLGIEKARDFSPIAIHSPGSKVRSAGWPLGPFYLQQSTVYFISLLGSTWAPCQQDTSMTADKSDIPKI